MHAHLVESGRVSEELRASFERQRENFTFKEMTMIVLRHGKCKLCKRAAVRELRDNRQVHREGAWQAWPLHQWSHGGQHLA